VLVLAVLEPQLVAQQVMVVLQVKQVAQVTTVSIMVQQVAERLAHYSQVTVRQAQYL
jgi:hypothetical protein